jgi:DNA (cytosine-5)-methyltransferase 1
MISRLDSRYNFVELYAGTARSTEAFRSWKRTRIGLLVDRDRFAFETYFQNRPDAPYLVRSVARMSAREIEAYAGGRVDILVGCPPCQGFSDTGARDPADGRNRHLTHFAMLAQSLKPLAVAMENVPLAANTQRFSAFVRRMDELGYRSTWGVLNAALRGSAQCRHRLIYVGIRDDVGVEPVLPKPTHGGTGQYFSYSQRKLLPVQMDRVSILSEAPAVRRVRTLGPYRDDEAVLGKLPIPNVANAWEDLPALGSNSADALGHYAWKHTVGMRRRMANVPEGGRWSGGIDHFSQSYGRLHREGLSNTLTTFFSNPGSGRFWHPVENRAITLREAARLQGFPDSFKFFPEAMASCRVIGNALDVQLAGVSYDVIRACLS